MTTDWKHKPFSRPWMEKVTRYIVTGKRYRALRMLDSVIEDLPLFRKNDPSIAEERRLGWLYRIDLLLEWGRLPEALAWTCLECDLNPRNVAALAMKGRLKAALDLSDPVHKIKGSKSVKLRCAWEGVAGMRHVKAILERDVILPFEEPELYESFKVDLPNGILFYGPPGCGKTFIARKLSEQLDFNFIEVKPSDLADIYIHGTQKKIKELFDSARESAPTLLFFDELDAIVPSRADESIGPHMRSEVGEFLVQVNECWKDKVLVIGATNLVSNIDQAVRRPGRMDKQVFVGPPDLEARLELIKQYMDGRPQEPIDWLFLAEGTELYTIAEIRELVNEAARIALSNRRAIHYFDFVEAMKVVTRSLEHEEENQRRITGFVE